jgi:hypothetical protein
VVLVTNRVDIEVTGTNKFERTNAAVLKDMRALEAQAVKTTAATRKLGTELDAKPKMDGVKEADKALKKLAETADEAFGKVKAKLQEGLGEAERERKLKIKAEVDKERLKSSVADGLGGLDFDFGKIGGGKLTSMLGMGLTKGLDLTQAGAKSIGSFVSGLGDGLKAQHPAVQAAVYGALLTAVLTVGPFLGATLAGGLIAGFGTGVAGLGIVAAAQSDRLRATYRDLWSEIVADVRSRSGLIEGVLDNTARRVKTAFVTVSTDIGRAFAAVSPGLEKLLDGLLQSIQRFTPALEPIAEAASAVFEDLGERLPGIIGEMADEFADLADIVKQNPEALGDFIATLGEVVEQVTLFLEIMTTTYNQVRSFFDFLGKGLDWSSISEGEEAAGKTGKAMLALGDVTGTATGKVDAIEQAFRDLAEAEDDATKRGDAYLEILNRLAGITPSFDDAMKSSNDTIRGLIENFTKSGAAADGFGKDLLTADGHINTTTANGSKLYDAISALRENFVDMAGATKELEAAGLSHDEAVKRVNESVAAQAQRLVEAADKMGLNQNQMRELLRLYGLTPEQIETLLKLDDKDFRARLQYDLQPQTKTIHVVYNKVNAPLSQGTGRQYGVTDFAHGGNVAKAAAGGVRSNEIIMNDGPGYPGEAVRLPNGSTVMPAGFSNELQKRFARGMGGDDGGGVEVVVYVDGEGMIDWMKGRARKRGGQPEVFG